MVCGIVLGVEYMAMYRADLHSRNANGGGWPEAGRAAQAGGAAHALVGGSQAYGLSQATSASGTDDGCIAAEEA